MIPVIRVALLTGLLATTSFAPDAGNPELSGDDTDEWRRFSERCASHSLRTMSEAEADFLENDRDWCTVNDFWTVDVAGLYTLTSTTVLMPGTEGALRVIEFTAKDGEESKEEAP